MTADMILTLEGQHFKRHYLLYVVKITHGNTSHYYIGQTGDTHATTARPAFRRLAGHLEDRGRSKENQVYRYLAETVLGHKEAADKKGNFSENTKQDVEDYLVDSIVKMHVYILQEFPSNINREDHLANVRKVTLFEKMVITLFIMNQKNVANKKSFHIPEGAPCPYPDILKRIKDDFQII
jgi:hypothetical protein